MTTEPFLHPLILRSAQRVSKDEGSSWLDHGTASWFETAFGLLTMGLLKSGLAVDLVR